MRTTPADRGCGWREDGQRGKTGLTSAPPPRTSQDLRVPERELSGWISSRRVGKSQGYCQGSKVLSPFGNSVREFLQSSVGVGESGSALACLACFSPASQRDSPSRTPKGAHEGPRGKALQSPSRSHSGLLRVFALG